MRIAPGLAAAGLFLVAVSASGGRVYRNDGFRISSFELPRGWQPAPQVAYPRILLLAEGPDGARLVLAAQRVQPGTAALAVATEARTALVRQGFVEAKVEAPSPGPGSSERVRLDAAVERPGVGRRVLRQMYVVEGEAAITVTMVAPANRQTRAMRDLDAAMESLVLASPSATPAPAPEPPGLAVPVN